MQAFKNGGFLTILLRRDLVGQPYLLRRAGQAVSVENLAVEQGSAHIV
ncbi:MAG: hypothetical protein ACKO4U_16445 [Caldilinea sp.]